MSAKKIKKVKTMPSSVCRVKKNANYTVMSNYHLRSTNLSLKAIGLLSKVLSLPENWDYSNTTRKHLYIFLRMYGYHYLCSAKDMRKAIKDKEVILQKVESLNIL